MPPIFSLKTLFPVKTYSVDKEEKGHSFILGNTKFLRDMNQKELSILADNGDPRVKVDESEDKPADNKKGGKPAPAAEPAA